MSERTASDYLILDLDNFGDNLQNFYKTLNNSAAHQKLFLADPTGVLIKMVFPEQERSSMEINAANRLLYSMLSNPRFMEWAKSHQEKMQKDALEATKIEDQDEAMRVYSAVFDKQKALTEILKGLKETMDVEITGALFQALHVFRGRPVRMRNESQTTASGTNSVAHEAVELTYVVLVIYVAALFVIGIPFGRIEGVTREDLLNLSTRITEQMNDKANKMRQSGDLNPIDV